MTCQVNTVNLNTSKTIRLAKNRNNQKIKKQHCRRFRDHTSKDDNVMKYL